MITYEDFTKLDIRVGQITSAEYSEKAKKPAYKLWVDLGEDLGIKTSSAQVTECYKKDDLIGRQVLCVINFPPRNIAGFISEVLVLGIYASQGVVLIQPEQPVKKGDKAG